MPHVAVILLGRVPRPERRRPLGAFLDRAARVEGHGVALPIREEVVEEVPVGETSGSTEIRDLILVF